MGILELLYQDLCNVVEIGSKTIASEESINLMLHIFKNQSKFTTISLIHENELHAILKRIINSNSTVPMHVQFLVEQGARSKLKRNEPMAIHYYPLDIYICNDKTYAFLADHSRGHKSFTALFQNIASDLKINFIIPGGNVYQADNTHCMFFALQHLILTAKDINIPQFLLEKQAETINYISWSDLPSSYIVHSQSVSYLFEHINIVKKKEKSPSLESSHELVHSKFAESLTDSLVALPNKDFRLHLKLQNMAIIYTAAKYAGEAIKELETNQILQKTETLITICYKERYPKVYLLLMKALEIECKYPASDRLAHPLFGFAFQFAGVLENLLLNTAFSQILHSEEFLTLCQFNLLDPDDVCKNIILSDGRSLQVEQNQCKKLLNNLLVAKKLVEFINNGGNADKSTITALFFSTKINVFFKNKVLENALFQGRIDLRSIELIATDILINFKSHTALPESQQLDILTKFELKNKQAIPIVTLPSFFANKQDLKLPTQSLSELFETYHI